jgi:uncharacterized protein (DUF1697 family)
MTDWKALLEAAGCSQVETYLQSGQAVVTSDLSPTVLRERVASDLSGELSVDTVVMVRTHAELAALVQGCPWPELAAQSPKLVHACFVDAAPSARWRQLDAGSWAPDEVVEGEGVVYVRFEHGAGRSKVPLTDRQLGTPGTSRNWNTIEWLLQHSGTPVPD